MSLDLPTLQARRDFLKFTSAMSWEAVRYQVLYQAVTDQNGRYDVAFVPPFENAVLGFSVALDFSGGPRSWCIGFTSLSVTGFTTIVCDLSSNPVPNTTVGIYYSAIGR